MKRVYLDSSVLLAAIRRQDQVGDLAKVELSRDDVELVFSDFVKLEVLPLPEYYRNEHELKVYRAYFARARQAKVAIARAVHHAKYVGVRDGLAGMDALHLAVAELDGVDELVSLDADFERATSVATRFLRAPNA